MSPSSITVVSGTPSTLNVTLTPLRGYAGGATVAIAAAFGLTVSPSSLTFPAAADPQTMVVNVSTTSATPQNALAVTFTATGTGSLTATDQALVDIRQAAGTVTQVQVVRPGTTTQYPNKVVPFSATVEIIITGTGLASITNATVGGVAAAVSLNTPTGLTLGIRMPNTTAGTGPVDIVLTNSSDAVTVASAAVTLANISVNDATGNDTTGFGTPNNPFKTISFAITKAVQGDVIHVAVGTYSEPNGITLPDGMSLQGYLQGALVTTVDGNGANSWGVTMQGSGTIDTLRIKSYRYNIVAQSTLTPAAVIFLQGVEVLDSTNGDNISIGGNVVANIGPSRDQPTVISGSAWNGLAVLHDATVTWNGQRTDVATLNAIGITVFDRGALTLSHVDVITNDFHGVELRTSGSVSLEDVNITSNGEHALRANGPSDQGDDFSGTLTVTSSAVGTHVAGGVLLNHGTAVFQASTVTDTLHGVKVTGSARATLVETSVSLNRGAGLTVSDSATVWIRGGRYNGNKAGSGLFISHATAQVNVSGGAGFNSNSENGIRAVAGRLHTQKADAVNGYAACTQDCFFANDNAHSGVSADGTTDITGAIITGNSRHGVEVGGSSGNLALINCYAGQNRQSGVRAHATMVGPVEITGGTFLLNVADGGTTNAGIYIQGTGSVTITGATISNNAWHGVHLHTTGNVTLGRFDSAPPRVVVDANAGAGVIVDSSNAAHQVLIRNVDVTNSGTTGAAFQSTGGNTTAPTVTISDSTFKGNGQTADAPGVWFATTYPLTAHIRSTSIFENQYDGLKISNPSIVLTMGAGPINPAWCDPSQSTCTTAVHLHSNDLTWDGGLSGSTKDSAHADLHDARPHNATNPNIEIYAVDFNNAETLTRDTVYGNASATPVREVLPLGALYYGLLMDDGRNKVRTH